MSDYIISATINLSLNFYKHIYSFPIHKYDKNYTLKYELNNRCE